MRAARQRSPVVLRDGGERRKKKKGRRRVRKLAEILCFKSCSRQGFYVEKEKKKTIAAILA